MHLVASSPSSARRAARVLSGLSLPQAMGATVAILVFAIAARPALDPDLWWHLRSGHWMLDHHAILRADPFSHTRRGVVREPTDWLSELALYGAWAAAGLAGVAFLVAAIASAGSALLLRACRGSLAVRFASVVLAAAASSVFWSARPQMATYLGCVVVVVLMVQLRAGRLEPHRLAWLVPLFALWSNLHLGWFYGLGIVGGTLVGEWIERARGRSGLPPDAFRALAAALLA